MAVDVHRRARIVGDIGFDLSTKTTEGTGSGQLKKGKLIGACVRGIHKYIPGTAGVNKGVSSV